MVESLEVSSPIHTQNLAEKLENMSFAVVENSQHQVTGNEYLTDRILDIESLKIVSTRYKQILPGGKVKTRVEIYDRGSQVLWTDMGHFVNYRQGQWETRLRELHADLTSKVPEEKPYLKAANQ